MYTPSYTIVLFKMNKADVYNSVPSYNYVIWLCCGNVRAKENLSKKTNRIVLIASNMSLRDVMQYKLNPGHINSQNYLILLQ